jgi:hypothetical protein
VTLTTERVLGRPWLQVLFRGQGMSFGIIESIGEPSGKWGLPLAS